MKRETLCAIVMTIISCVAIIFAFWLALPHCKPGECKGHFSRYGPGMVGYCDRESCLKQNPKATRTVDMFGEEKK